jgi:tetratricopeptide (TPR) repeat protein
LNCAPRVWLRRLLVAHQRAVAEQRHRVAVALRATAQLEQVVPQERLATAERDAARPVEIREFVEHAAPLAGRQLLPPAFQGDSQYVAALTVLALLSIWSADIERSRRLGEQLLSLAQTAGVAELESLMLSHWVLGHSCTLQGQLAAAREHLEQALALHSPEAGRALTPPVEADPVVAAQVLLGTLRWQLGYPDQGRAGLRHALALAEAIDQPPTLGFAHLMAGITSVICNHHGPAALHHAQALRFLANAGQEYAVWSDLLATWVQVHDDWLQRRASAGGAGAPHDPDVARAAQAVSALYALGPGAGYSEAVTIYAQICAWVGEPEMGLSANDEALAWIDRTGMRIDETEVWRTRGELVLSAGGAEPFDASDKAEACFQRALEIARDQQARWLELRAAISLAPLWQAQGRPRETRELLAGIYGWFTEGFDMPDLQEAKALLGSAQTAGVEPAAPARASPAIAYGTT